MSQKHSRTFIIEDVRTINLPAGAIQPELGRAVNIFGGYTDGVASAVFGYTIQEARRPGVPQTFAPVPAIAAATAYTAGTRLTLTAAQAVNIGGQAGIYQVTIATTGFAAAVPTVAEVAASGLVFVGASLQRDYILERYNGSTTPQLNRATAIPVAISGRLTMEAGAALTAGQPVALDAQGRAIVGTVANRIGVALTNVSAAGLYVTVEVTGVK